MAKSEWVDLVDRTNQVVGQAQRHEVRSKNLLHRGIAVWVENSQGEVYVHQRTSSKDLFPSLFDMFVGGVVGAGESYEAAAQREAAEELGARGGDGRAHHRGEPGDGPRDEGDPAEARHEQERQHGQLRVHRLATVVVDELSLQYMGGSELDYVEDLIGSAFKIHNPLAVSGCGCGTSFAV